ncbi:hypothetical protein GCM10023213_20460 [Prosthecobacter algae]|uniref:Uncharacterized protein n=1 Tax=Prosthecobacter algae TaxID=1144682 RepID=A0ABP9P316_9BACT
MELAGGQLGRTFEIGDKGADGESQQSRSGQDLSQSDGCFHGWVSFQNAYLRSGYDGNVERLLKTILHTKTLGGDV